MKPIAIATKKQRLRPLAPSRNTPGAPMTSPGRVITINISALSGTALNAVYAALATDWVACRMLGRDTAHIPEWVHQALREEWQERRSAGCVCHGL